MKNGMAILILCLLFNGCNNDLAATSAWSDRGDGLLSALHVSGIDSMRTELPVSILFSNSTSTALKLPDNLYYSLSWSWNDRICGEPVGTARLDGMDAPLAPHTQISIRMTGIRTDLNGPGKYRISGGIAGLKLDPVEITLK